MALFFFCALNIFIYRLINDVGPKIKVDNVGFRVGPMTLFGAIMWAH